MCKLFSAGQCAAELSGISKKSFNARNSRYSSRFKFKSFVCGISSGRRVAVMRLCRSQIAFLQHATSTQGWQLNIRCARATWASVLDHRLRPQPYSIVRPHRHPVAPAAVSLDLRSCVGPRGIFYGCRVRPGPAPFGTARLGRSLFGTVHY